MALVGAIDSSIASDLSGKMAAASKADVSQGLLDTMASVFGYDTARGDQLAVMEKILGGQDCCVFWSTGYGKSLCYQIPALYTGKTVVVVSPLISLMMDQVAKLTSTTRDSSVACFLGSAQMDPTVDSRACRGEYNIVYATPERFTSEGFMCNMAELFAAKKLLFVAVDEAHCGSEWSHDFRPAFARIGDFRVKCPGCPYMALTATAVPKVQDDLHSALRLKNPFTSVSTVFRSNLFLKAVPMAAAASSMAERAQVVAATYAKVKGSCICYCVTISDVEQAAAHLKRCVPPGTLVRTYHGKMDPSSREQVHMEFLSGKCPIVAATIAFGMGIDKPDIRCVFHMGPAKTFEEYYQQVGRAGRDGLMAQAVMFHSDSAFTKYESDFYRTGNKQADEAQGASRQALKRFAESDRCRWATVVEYFSSGTEVPPFGNNPCGVCDNCADKATYAGDLERDYGPDVQTFLRVFPSYPTSMTGLKKQIGEWTRQKIITDRRLEFWLEILPSLISKGFINKRSQTTTYGAYASYSVSLKGRQFTQGSSTKQLLLKVPQCERQRDAKLKEKLEALKESGVDLSRIPQSELKAGQGETLSAEMQWVDLLASYRKQGRGDRAAKMVLLLDRLREWRAAQAAKIGRIAPAAVCSEALLKKIAYVRPSGVEALRSCGVRVGDIAALAQCLRDSEIEFGWAVDVARTTLAVPLKFKRGLSFADPKTHSSYRAPSSRHERGLANYMVSVYRFTVGMETMAAIAVDQGVLKNGQPKKPVKKNTIVNHLMTAALDGAPIDWSRVVQEIDSSELPTKRDWEMLTATLLKSGLDPMDRSIATKQIVEAMYPQAAIPSDQRTPEQSAQVTNWYSKVKWFLTLKQIEYPVQFDEPQSAPPRAVKADAPPRALKKRRTWGFDAESASTTPDAATAKAPQAEAAPMDTGPTASESTASAAQPSAQVMEADVHTDIGGLLDDLGDDFFDDE